LFPVAAGAARSDPAEAASAEEIEGAGSVLVADEDELIRDMVRTALERRGYSVLLAEDGETALAVFDQAVEQISAVLLDIALPGLSGPELVGYIRRRRPGLAVVLSTAYSESQFRERFGSAEPLVYVTKPYTADRIVRALAQACRAGLKPRAC
jgi:CheY-like chemotaxis protein